MRPASSRPRVEILRAMILVRAFEDQLTAMVREGRSPPGIQILSTGQEAAVAVVLALRDGDVMVSNHRNHAHLLARGADPGALMAEIMGKAAGVNRGKSGTLHLVVPEVNALMTSTVVGAGPPMAVGAAFAQQYRGEDSLTAVFFGDGAAAEGSVHEAMNLAGVWRLPVLFVCENNRWAGAQPLEVHLAGGGVAARAASYGMSAATVDGNDADAVSEAAIRFTRDIRGGSGPGLLELMTYRMHGHSEADAQLYVDPAELEAWRPRDPIDRYAARLVEERVVDASELEAMRRSGAEAVGKAVAFAQSSPPAPPEEILRDVFRGV